MYAKLERMKQWQSMRLWYLKQVQPQFYRWLTRNRMLQAHLALVADEAEAMFEEILSPLADPAYVQQLGVEDETAVLCLISQTCHEASALVAKQVLFARPPKKRSVQNE